MISFTAKYFEHGRHILDEVGYYVQEIGGYFETRRSYVIEFFVPVDYRDFILMKYPFLTEVAYIL